MTELLFEQESYAIRGCAMRVHTEMGSRFLEAVYQECMSIEFEEAGIPSEAQKELELHYKKRKLKKKYVADFVCHSKIIIELKCIEKIGKVEIAQAMNYLKATGFRLALIINFSTSGPLQIERVVL